MTPKEIKEDKRFAASLERVALYAKDITSYLDTINDKLSEILDYVEAYQTPHQASYTYEIGKADDE